jgi:hypothetical protein
MLYDPVREGAVDAWQFFGNALREACPAGGLSPQGMAVGSVVGGYTIPPPQRFG